MSVKAPGSTGSQVPFELPSVIKAADALFERLEAEKIATASDEMRRIATIFTEKLIQNHDRQDFLGCRIGRFKQEVIAERLKEMVDFRDKGERIHINSFLNRCNRAGSGFDPISLPDIQTYAKLNGYNVTVKSEHVRMFKEDWKDGEGNVVATAHMPHIERYFDSPTKTLP